MTAEPMTEEERKAMEWLEAMGRLGYPHYEERARTLKAMLAEPRLPEELPDDAKKAMRAAFETAYLESDFIEAIYRALYAHLTKPKTKTVEVWHCESAIHLPGRGWSGHVSAHGSRESAEDSARALRTAGHPEAKFACIRVTGPHQQEVPA